AVSRVCLLTSTAPPWSYTLSLHDALPIFAVTSRSTSQATVAVADTLTVVQPSSSANGPPTVTLTAPASGTVFTAPANVTISASRSEEHTSELQSRRDSACRLLLEKKQSQR